MDSPTLDRPMPATAPPPPPPEPPGSGEPGTGDSDEDAARGAPPPMLSSPVPPEVMRRLQGEGCILCGSTEGLAPAGFAYTRGADGSPLGWPVTACRRHLREAASVVEGPGPEDTGIEEDEGEAGEAGEAEESETGSRYLADSAEPWRAVGE